MPDTGASIDCISEKFAKRHNLTVVPDDDIDLIAAEGQNILVTGIAELELQLNGGEWIRSLALVCPKLSQEMLLSWISQKKLNKMPAFYLHQEKLCKVWKPAASTS